MKACQECNVCNDELRTCFWTKLSLNTVSDSHALSRPLLVFKNYQYVCLSEIFIKRRKWQNKYLTCVWFCFISFIFPTFNNEYLLTRIQWNLTKMHLWRFYRRIKLELRWFPLDFTFIFHVKKWIDWIVYIFGPSQYLYLWSVIPEVRLRLKYRNVKLMRFKLAFQKTNNIM